MWSDGTTIWIADRDGQFARLIAYKLADGAHDPARDFTLSQSAPQGVWGKGDTVWVANAGFAIFGEEKAFHRVYSYRLPLSDTNDVTLSSLSVSPSPPVPSFTATLRPKFAYPWFSYSLAVPNQTSRVTISAVASNSETTIAYLDANGDALEDADTTTAGIQVDVAVGKTTISMTLASGGTALTYSVFVERDSAILYGWTPTKDFNNLLEDNPSLAGDGMRGLWADETTLYVSPHNEPNIFAYTRATGARDTNKDIATNQGTLTHRYGLKAGIWSDGMTMWVLTYDLGEDGEGTEVFDGTGKVLAFDISTRGRDIDKEFPLHLAPTFSARGIWSDGTTVWISDWIYAKLFAYTLDTGARDTAKDITLHIQNVGAQGIWSDGTTMWVAEFASRKFYAYTLDTGAYDPDESFDRTPDNSYPREIWSDGTTLYVPDATARKVFSYNMAVVNSPATGQPTTIGTAQEGNALGVDVSGIEDGNGIPGDVVYSYRWQADGVDITGAEAPTYWLAASDIGKRISVEVTFTDSDGFVETLTSAQTDTVTDDPTLTVVWSATITAGVVTAAGFSGFSTLGRTLGSLSMGMFDVGGNSHEVGEATCDGTGSSLYFAIKPDLSGQFTLAYGSSDKFRSGDATSAPSNSDASFTEYTWNHICSATTRHSEGEKFAVAVMLPVNAPATGQPTVSGTAQEGDALSADVSGISDGNGIPEDAAYSFQWQADGVDITGAEAPTYWLAASDIGKRISVQVTFTDSAGYVETLTSAQTAAVTDDPTLTVVWSATITAGVDPIHGISGFTTFLNAFGSLSVGTFDVGDNRHEVGQVDYFVTGSSLLFVIKPDLSGQFTLAYGSSDKFLSRDATSAPKTLDPSFTAYTWDMTVPLTHSEGEKFAVAVMLPVDFPPTGQVTIEGAFLEDEVLTANTSAIEDANGLTGVSYSYQWTRSDCEDSANNGDISGATASTRTLTATDVTCVISVKVTFEDDAGFEHELTATAVRNPAAVTVTLVAEGDGATLEYGTIPMLFVQEEAGNVQLGLRAVTNGDSRPAAGFQITVQSQESQDDTAKAGEDYQSFSQTFSFAPSSFREESGRYVHTVWKTLRIVDDAVTEKTEDFPLQIGDPSHADVTLAHSEAVVEILDSDVTTLSLTCLPAYEGEPITVRITPDTPASFTFSLIALTVSGTAVVGSDYTRHVALEPFASLLAEKTITIETKEDINDDGDKTFEVVLARNGLDADILIGNDRVDCTIRDNGITPPGAPTVTVSPRDRSLFATWTVPDDGGRTTDKYQVQWKTGDEGFSTRHGNTLDRREATITNLGNGKRYLVRVRASNNGGMDYGDWSSGEPGSPQSLPVPTSFSALWFTRLTRSTNPPVEYHKTQDTLTVSWFVVRGATEYQVEYRQRDETGDWTRVSGYFDHLPSTTRGHRPVAVATGLDCNTEYDFRVRAGNQDDPLLEPLDGWTPYDYTQARTAPCAEPDRITNVLATVDPQCADLSWTAPTAGQPSGYRIERFFFDTPNGAWETIEEDTRRAAATYSDCSQEYEDHEGGVAYHITALGAEGFGATQILYKKPSGQPNPPRNVRLTRDTQFVRTLEWDQAPEAWRTTVLAGREGRMRNIVVPDLWPTWYQVERHEFTGDPEGRWSFPDGSDWEVMRSAADENTSRSYTDNEDRGNKLYVYRVIPHNSVGAALVFRDDWAFDGPTYTLPLDNVQGDDQQQDPAPTVSSASITSSPGADGTYAIGDVVEATVTFSEAVNITGSPRLTLRIGGQSRTASYARGSGATALVFAHTVQEGDQGGVSIGASAVSLNEGSINAVDDAQAATLTHAAVTASGHTVDGVQPALGSAAVNGAILTLAYGEALDRNSTPSPGAFTVSVAGTARSVSSVSVSGSQVSLTLAPAVGNGDTVTVSYTAPDVSRLRDQAGNAAASFSGRTVTNDTEAATDDTAGGGDATPLTASLENAPEAHDGEAAFTFELRFSEEFDLSYQTLRDHAFTVVGGVVEKAQRLTKGSNIGWRITVQPDSNADVTITLPVTEDCGHQGAICTEDGKRLSNRLELTVSGPDS